MQVEQLLRTKASRNRIRLKSPVSYSSHYRPPRLTYSNSLIVFRSRTSHVLLLLHRLTLRRLIISISVCRNVVEGVSDENGDDAAKDNTEDVR
jgi:hypothetical protein